MGYDRFQEEELAPQNFCAWDRALTTAPPCHPQFSPLGNKGNMPGQPSAPQPCGHPEAQSCAQPCASPQRPAAPRCAPGAFWQRLVISTIISAPGRGHQARGAQRTKSRRDVRTAQAQMQNRSVCSGPQRAAAAPRTHAGPALSSLAAQRPLVPGPPRASPVCG